MVSLLFPRFDPAFHALVRERLVKRGFAPLGSSKILRRRTEDGIHQAVALVRSRWGGPGYCEVVLRLDDPPRPHRPLSWTGDRGTLLLRRAMELDEGQLGEAHTARMHGAADPGWSAALEAGLLRFVERTRTMRGLESEIERSAPGMMPRFYVRGGRHQDAKAAFVQLIEDAPSEAERDRLRSLAQAEGVDID